MSKAGHGSVLLRLSEKERDILKILLAALKVSEYTDDVDAVRSYRREEKMINAMREVFVALAGLSHVAGTLPSDVLKKLQQSAEPDMQLLEPVLAKAFEIGRRFKRLNPDKMRSEYGKLTMLLQDSKSMQNKTGLKKIIVPVHTVGYALDRLGVSAVLTDRRVTAATTPLPVNSSPEAVAEKNDAREAIVAEFGSDDDVKREVIDRCLRSIDDAHSFILMNTAPVETLKSWLGAFATEGDSKYALKISQRVGGSCLSQSHESHLKYVMEALTLWGIVQRDIFDFWQTVEEDMILAGHAYRFCDTGQGFHRMSSGPETYSRIHAAIAEADKRMGGWVGSKVVHLGDRDVPNPLVFIDKYTIIPRLLSPIVQTMKALDAMFDGEEPYPGIRKLVLRGFTSVDDCKRTILADFFKHGFDGSGDDGGSCIDGRLTSAWNWCSNLHKKKYYNVFVLTGFTGFDANYNN
jgi:hypothetical protein